MALKAAIATSLFLGFLVGCDSKALKPSARSGGESTIAEPRPIQSEEPEVWRRQVAYLAKNNEKLEIRGVRDGKAEISLDRGQTWIPASKGMFFLAGAIIRTDARASVDLFSQNALPLRVGPGSYARIVRWEIEDTGIEKILEILIELERGRLSGTSKKMAAASTFMVRTEKAIIEPFGSFEIEADGAVVAGGGRLHSGGEVLKLEAGQKLLF